MRNEPSDTGYASVVRMDRASLWAGRTLLLQKLDIEITERCNLDCIHCYINRPAGDPAARRVEMPAERIEEVLREAAGLGALSVRFTGGEPLLRGDFEELYLFARRLGLRVILFTNATLITTRLADLFARVPPLEKIEVTLYGMEKESYEGVTGRPGSHEANRRGMELLRERRIPFVVKAAFFPPGAREMDKIDAFAATLPASGHPPSQVLFLDLRARRDSEEKNRRIRDLRADPERGLAVLKRQPERYRREMEDFCGRFMEPPGEDLFGCGAGMGGGCVDACGLLQPCMTLRHPETVYDLGKGSLREAFTDFFPRLRERKATNPEYLARCARCFLKGLCEQCPAKSWMEHGTLDTPVEYLCQVAQVRARDLGLLGDDERPWEIGDWRERVRRFAADGRGEGP